jgi:hypothetical protein
MTKHCFRIVARAALMLGVAAGPAAANEVTLTGTVSDAMCGANHHGREAVECTRACAAESGAYVLIVGTRIYTLVAEDDAREQLYELAGKRVVVTGDRVAGDVITVKTVNASAAQR